MVSRSMLGRRARGAPGTCSITSNGPSMHPLRVRISFAHGRHVPQAPFRWTFGERSMVGYFLPEFRRSRRMFERRGVPTGRSRWPDADAMAWPAGHIEAKSQFNHGTEEEA